MTMAAVDALPRLSLSQLLAEKPVWSVRERLMLARRLAAAVQALHRAGTTHRALDAATITLDGQLDPQLGPPAGPRRFGGDQCDPEFCPPQLAQSSAVDLPADIEAATAILRQRGIPLDPRRIDVYQLGVLLCQLLTGEPFLSYHYSPTCKARVPPLARAVLECCLGENTNGSLVDCGDLVEALDDSIRQLPEPHVATAETPPSGSIVIEPDVTPPRGKVAAVSSTTPRGQLPFQRLGHFEIVAHIGSGGMGDVYQGYDASLDRNVAIKVLAPALARDEEFVRRFSAEATAAAKLSHPNVVPIYSIGQDAGNHFFVMQFIEGQSLAQRLSSAKRLPVDEAVAIVEQCLAGLEAAHAQGLIHRDVKPGNILLERHSGRAVLVDFGLARHLNADSRMTATGVVMGTVNYLAPEQAKGKAVDGRADIYSLGVMFYELLAGRLPFLSDSHTAMIFQHAYEEPFPLKQGAPDVPQPLIDIIAHMMAKEPAERYPSCAAVLADLRAFREGRPLAIPVALGVTSVAKASVGAASVGKAPVAKAVRMPPKPAASPRAATASVPADYLAADSELRHTLLPPENPLQRAIDWAATIFHRHAPQYFQEMQTTTQQMDGAVDLYERRRNGLANLLDEARGIEAALFEQIEAQLAEAAAAADCLDTSATQRERQAAQGKKHKHEESAASLRSQYDLQRQQVEELDRQLGKTDATLARLRSQQQLLKARLQAAEARRQLEGGPTRPTRRRWLVPMAVGTGAMAVMSLILILSRDLGSPVPIEPPPTTIVPSRDPQEGFKTVVEGVGWGGFRVGATREALIKLFGPPDPNTDPAGHRLYWTERYHVDCDMDEAHRAVRFSSGFELPLTSGIRIGSSESEALSAYGIPDATESRTRAKLLHFNKHGVRVLVSDGKVISFSVFKPRAAELSPKPSTDARGATFARDAKLNDAQRQWRDSSERQFKTLLDPPQWHGLSAAERAAKEEELLLQLTNNDRNTRISAINALAVLDSKRAVPGLLAIATARKDGNNRDRWMAIRALGILGDASVVPELVHLTYHYNRDTRTWAQISMVRLTGENFADYLAAWRRWWESQGGRPPISEERIAWGPSAGVPASPAEALPASGPRDVAGLEGEWEITLPAGFIRRLSILHLDGARYRISRSGNSSGIYELRGDKLVVVEPDDKRLTEFVWHVEDPNRMVLIESPAVSKVGSDYRGAILKRVSE